MGNRFPMRFYLIVVVVLLQCHPVCGASTPRTGTSTKHVSEWKVRCEGGEATLVKCPLRSYPPDRPDFVAKPEAKCDCCGYGRGWCSAARKNQYKLGTSTNWVVVKLPGCKQTVQKPAPARAKKVKREPVRVKK